MSLTEVRWLQQTEADVPGDNEWLSRSEASQADSLLIPKRRSDWRLGRWTAKRAVSIYLSRPLDEVSLSTIEIRAAASGAPEVFIRNAAADITISLSHRCKAAICAVTAARVQLGCDLELIEAHSQAFIRDYFTADEQRVVDSSDQEEKHLLATLIWSAKESALKALRTGLREDTRSVSVCASSQLPRKGCWTQLGVRTPGAHLLSGWWQRTEDFVLTMVGAPALRVPNPLVESGQLKSIKSPSQNENDLDAVYA